MLKVEFVECRFDEATEDEPGHHAMPRNWREDRFASMLEAIGCSRYGHADEGTPLASAVVHFNEDDETSHYVIDTPLFTLRPYYWGDSHEIYFLPNFVYKPWDLEISWYKYPMRYAHVNMALTDEDWNLMCDTTEWAVRAFSTTQAWPLDIDDAPRMGEVDGVAWELRKRMDTIAVQRNKLEDALYTLWRYPLSRSARDDAARLLCVGRYEIVPDS